MELSKKVGLVVPIYNASRFLRECLEAILNQSYQNLEVVLVDDGRTDKESVEIAEDYVQRDLRLVLFIKENGGQGSARNVGIEYCLGKYVLDYLGKNKNLFEYKINGENLYNVDRVYRGDSIDLSPKVDYLMFVDSDDFLEIQCVEECVKNIGDSPVLWFDFKRFYDGVEGKE